MEQKKCKQAAGSPAWIMTFADLMSLLLAFFVLLFSFSELDRQKYKQLSGSMREAFGVQREVSVKDIPKGVNIIAREFSPGRPDPTPLNVVKQHTTDDLQTFLEIPKADNDADKQQDNVGDNDQEKAGDGEAENLKQTVTDVLKSIIESEYQKIKQALQKEISEGLIDVEREGQKVIIRIREHGSYPSGSATLKGSFRPVITKISRALKGTQGNIVVAGHTDDRAIYTDRFRSNWELSSARAVTVVHALVVEGDMQIQRFQVAGFAETQPLEDNATEEGRAKNRRVEVQVVYGNDEERMTAILEQITSQYKGLAAPHAAPEPLSQEDVTR